MYEEKKFSWTNLFIKIIIVVIFILFTIWLLSLSTKGMSNSLNVLTDNIFSENIDKMKDVGQSYFTTERLPKKVGDIKTLTLEKMYDKKLLLELKDKKGNACSAKNSYVSIEKLENEYQMKVYLECGEDSDYIIVIMGCYNYCDTDICEKKEEPTPEIKKELEYEYSKTTGGSWGPWGSWSEWSKTSVTKNNYRDVETKVVAEEYTYYEEESETKYIKDATCPTVSGYSLVSMDADGVCKYSKTTTVTADPTCPEVDGYKNTGRDGFTCNYSKTTTVKTTKPAECPEGYAKVDGTCKKTTTETTTKTASCPSGYSKVDGTCKKTTTETTTKTANCPSGYSKSGNTCAKTTTETTTKTASCPSGYNKSGNTCAKTTTETTTKPANVTCPTVTNWTYVNTTGTTCNYKRTVQSSEYTLTYVETKTGSYVPADTNTYHYEQVGADYVYDCNNQCAFVWIYTYKVYKKTYKTITETATRTGTVVCPTVSGYTNTGRDGLTCNYSKTTTVYANPVCPTVSGYTNTGRDGFTCNYSKSTTTTTNPVCPTVSGYTNTGRDGFTCNYSKSTTTTTDPVCPTVSGYAYTGRNGYTCSYSKTTTATTDPVCPAVSGYKNTGRDGFTCNYSKTTTVKTTKDAVCPEGYSKSDGTCKKSTTSKTTKDSVCQAGQTNRKGKCYETTTRRIEKKGTKNVTYYRYRLREYTGGTTVYKWSSSNHDKSLLDAGYTLTGKTREKGGK